MDETKGERSASDRVNDLLRRAIIQEQYERLAMTPFRPVIRRQISL
jgi:hypothetical protein